LYFVADAVEAEEKYQKQVELLEAELKELKKSGESNKKSESDSLSKAQDEIKKLKELHSSLESKSAN